MTDFPIHSIEGAPEKSQPLLENAKKAAGFVPNLYGVMAESPEHLEAYLTLSRLFQRSALTTVEQNVVWLTINVEHQCHYCVPAHTAIAKGAGVPDDVIDALREARALPDEKLEALRQFTLQVVRQRGVVADTDVQAFFDAGYDQHAVLDVILGLAQKVMSNYVNHFADTPVDEAFRPFAWHPTAS